MKAIALIVVHGGVAYAYAPEHVDVRIVDRDNMDSDGEGNPEPKEQLPAGVGFEELVADAGIEEYVRFE